LYGGAGVYDCVKTGDVALTFDDGPYVYTSALLDKLRVSDALSGWRLSADSEFSELWREGDIFHYWEQSWEGHDQ